MPPSIGVAGQHEDLRGHAHQQRLHGRQGQRQAERDARALAGLRTRVHRAVQALHGRLDNIHAHAAARHIGDDAAVVKPGW